MDANTIVQLVGSLGFPIVCCGALFIQQNKTNKDFSEKMEKSVEALAKNIEQNTIAVNVLVATVRVLSGKEVDVDGK